MARTPADYCRATLQQERGTIFKSGRFRIALCYPGVYAIGMASLGFQVIYRICNEQPLVSCERAFLPDTPSTDCPITLETQTRLGEFDVVAFSVAYELELAAMLAMLESAGIELLADRRPAWQPTVLVGGPITRVNPAMVAAVADLIVVGDGEEATTRLTQVLTEATSKERFLEVMAEQPAVLVPRIHGESVPEQALLGRPFVPACSQILTPAAKFGEALLMEVSRGCNRKCTFCATRSSRERRAQPAEILRPARPAVRKVGLIGAAISDHPQLPKILSELVGRGLRVGISSLRAEKLTEEMATLLRQGGARTLTVAADGPSERLRRQIRKGLRTEHLIRSAELTKRFGFDALKLYVMLGLPDETEEDVRELERLLADLSKMVPRLKVAINPFVPKPGTPLAEAPFCGVGPYEAKIRRLRKHLGSTAKLRVASAKWAWVEHQLAHSGPEVAHAAIRARRAGGSYTHWRRALQE